MSAWSRLRQWWQAPRAGTEFATRPPATPAQPDWNPHAATAVPRGQGLIVVHRVSALDGTFGLLTVVVDRQPVFDVRYNQRCATPASPGVHQVAIVAGSAGSDVVQTLVPAGGTVHLLAELSTPLALPGAETLRAPTPLWALRPCARPPEAAYP